MRVPEITCYFILLAMLLSCETGRKTDAGSGEALFILQDNKSVGIDFINQVEYTEEYNTYTYRNFYNGGGVGIGDINNDGLPDLYFTGNIVDNKLYLNKGNFRFKDITVKAGVACPGVWSTGVSMADINGDGWLDIYVCKSGDPDTENRHNELFINNGDLTFTEKAKEYGLDNKGLSTHAAFFDYDKDGDLDCYLLNNSFQSVTGYELRKDQRKIRDPLGGNKFYRNDDGLFVDISEEANIYGSAIGFGLGVTVGDINKDGWLDIYVSNDFYEKDYLYINRQDGTFREELEDHIRELSLGSMGADMADINNDGHPEIFVTEMLPEPEDRLKTKVVYETWERYRFNIEQGYYRQFARNVLQLNNRNGSFSEIGRYAGVYATDWSWGALVFDMDNDGWKDIFVANGIFKDLLDQDYLNFYSDPAIVRNMIRTEEQAILKMIDAIPSERVPNYAFRNRKDLVFENQAASWGLDKPSHSNGAAYADLDNDGDLDLVINNVNMPPFIYKSLVTENTDHHYLTLKLTGNKKNKNAIGANAALYAGRQQFYQEMIPARGFQSNVDSRLIFGLGDITLIDSLVINWPDNRQTTLYEINTNQILELDIRDARSPGMKKINEDHTPVLKAIVDVEKIIDYVHHENEFNEFERSRLLFHMRSSEGPAMDVADVNNDGLDDMYIGGAKDSPGRLYIQQKDGSFTSSNQALFEKDKISEDTDCLFFDADNDGDMDLYVACGGAEFPSSSSALIDRLYFNDGQGLFTRSDQILPSGKFESTSVIKAYDYDGDGDIDLFAGIRLMPFYYGNPVNGYLLENDGEGNFNNVTAERAPDLSGIGMITAMEWADVDTDGDADMIIAGDYMPVKILINENGYFTDRSLEWGMEATEGWYHTLRIADLDADGHPDIIAGNHGLNSKFKASVEKPVTMYVNDFDQNGTIEQIITTFNGDTAYPMIMKHDLVSQLPGLKKKYPTYADYKNQTINDIFTIEQIDKALTLNVVNLSTCVFINDGQGKFEKRMLPREAQFAPVYAIHADDLNGDGNLDIVMGGNLYRAKPETGIYDATYGIFLAGDGSGRFNFLPYRESGLFLKGEIRDIQEITIGENRYLVFARNNQKLKLFKINRHED